MTDETRITKNDSSMNGQYPVKSSFFGEGSSNMKQRIDQSSKNEYTGKTLVRSNLSVSSLNTFDAIPDIPTTTGTE